CDVGALPPHLPLTPRLQAEPRCKIASGSVFALGSVMSLPLLKRARDDAAVFVRVSPKRGGADAYGARSVQALMPGRALRAGEQYRFHVDMQSCIGCKCCVVACNEQNGNPAA